MKNPTAFIVDEENTLWTLEYDVLDNTVTVLSDKADKHGDALVSQYTLDKH